MLEENKTGSPEQMLWRGWSGCSSLPIEETKGDSWFDKLTTNGNRGRSRCSDLPKEKDNNDAILSPVKEEEVQQTLVVEVGHGNTDRP